MTRTYDAEASEKSQRKPRDIGCLIPCAPCPVPIQRLRSWARRTHGRPSTRCRRSGPVTRKAPVKIFLDNRFWRQHHGTHAHTQRSPESCRQDLPSRYAPDLLGMQPHLGTQNIAGLAAPLPTLRKSALERQKPKTKGAGKKTAKREHQPGRSLKQLVIALLKDVTVEELEEKTADLVKELNEPESRGRQAGGLQGEVVSCQ